MLFSKYITKEEMKRDSYSVSNDSFFKITNKVAKIRNNIIGQFDFNTFLRTAHPYENTNTQYFIENCPDKILKKDWKKFKKALIEDFSEKFVKLQFEKIEGQVHRIGDHYNLNFNNEEIIDFFKFSKMSEHLKIEKPIISEETIDVPFELAI